MGLAVCATARLMFWTWTAVIAAVMLAFIVGDCTKPSANAEDGEVSVPEQDSRITILADVVAGKQPDLVAGWNLVTSEATQGTIYWSVINRDCSPVVLWAYRDGEWFAFFRYFPLASDLYELEAGEPFWVYCRTG